MSGIYWNIVKSIWVAERRDLKNKKRSTAAGGDRERIEELGAHGVVQMNVHSKWMGKRRMKQKMGDEKKDRR